MSFIDELATKLKTIGSLKAVGETWFSIDGTIPPGGVPFMGQLVSRALYADLWRYVQEKGNVLTDDEWREQAEAQSGNCTSYSSGDGKTTFRMPCVKSFLKGADSISEAGKFVEEGLPNIEGKLRTSNGSMSTGGTQPTNVSGAFSAVDPFTGNTYTDAAGNGWKRYYIAFDASLFNSIYGRSDHVTPKSTNVLFGVYAVSILTNVGSADVSAFQTALATLEANVSTELNTKITSEVGGGGAEGWYVKFSSGLIIEGGKVSSVTSSQNVTINFPAPFTNENTVYVKVTKGNKTDATCWASETNPYDITTTSFTYHREKNQDPRWIAIGF